jgi:hypothetical protein
VGTGARGVGQLDGGLIGSIGACGADQLGQMHGRGVRQTHGHVGTRVYTYIHNDYILSIRLDIVGGEQGHPGCTSGRVVLV